VAVVANDIVLLLLLQLLVLLFLINCVQADWPSNNTAS